MLQPVFRNAGVLNRLVVVFSALIMLMIGPYLQWSIIAATNLQKPTIMEAAAGRGVYLFPTFYDIVLDPVNLYLLIVSFITFFPKSNLPIIDYFVLKSAVLTVFLTVFDGVFAWGRTNFLSSIITSLFFNLMGSLVLVFIYCFIFIMSSSEDNGEKIEINKTSSFMIFSASLLLVFVSFSVISLFLKPMNNRVGVVARPPFNIYWDAIEKNDPYYGDNIDGGVYPDPFEGFLARQRIRGKVEIDSYNLRFSAGDVTKATSAQVVVTPVHFCKTAVRDAEILRVPVGEGELVEVDAGDGLAHVSLNVREPFLIHYSDRYGEETIDRDGAGIVVAKRLRWKPFQFDLLGGFEANLSPTYTDDDKVKRSALRHVAIRLNGKTLRTFNLAVQKEFPEKVGRCDRSRPNKSLADGVTITFQAEPRVASRLKFSAAGGIAKIRTETVNLDDTVNLGDVRFLALGADRGAELRLDGAEGKPLARKDLWFRGHLVPEIDKEGRFSISGDADIVWSDNKLLSRSKWDSLDKEWQISFLGVFLALLAFISRFAISRFWGSRHRVF